MQLFAGLTPVIAIPFALRSYNSADFAILAITITLGSIYSLITDFGYTNLGTRHIALKKNKLRTCRAYIIGTGLERCIIALCYAPFIYIFLINTKYSDNAVTILLVALQYPLGLAAMPIWAYQGLERIKLMCIINILVRLGTISIFCVKSTDMDVILGASLLGSHWLISGALLQLINVIYAVNRPNVSGSLILKAIYFKYHEAKYIYLSNLSIFLYTSFNILFAGIFLSVNDFNFIFTIDRFVKGFLMILPPIIAVLLPIFARLHADKTVNANGILTKAIIIVAPLTIVIIIIGNSLIHILDILASFQLQVLIYSTIILPITINTILGVLGFVSSGNSKVLFRCIWPAATFNLIVIFPFTYYFSLNGLIFTILMSEIVVLVQLLRFTYRDQDDA